MIKLTSLVIIAHIIKLNNANEGVNKITAAVCKTSFELAFMRFTIENEITVFNILLVTYICASADGSYILHNLPCSSILRMVVKFVFLIEVVKL